MKSLKLFLTCLLAIVLCINIVPVMALDEDDPWTEYPADTAVNPTASPTSPAVTQPFATLPSSTTSPETTQPAPAEVPAPLVRITRQTLSQKPGANEQFTVTAVFHNYSDTSLLQGIAVFEPGDGLVLAEKSDSKVVPVIGPNGIAKVDVKLRAMKEYALTDIPVTVNYAYSYRSPQGILSGTVTDKLMIPMQPVVKAEETSAIANATPNIIVSKYNYGGTIAAGDTFTLHLEFTNTSKKTVAENIVMAIEASEDVSITSASNTYYYASLGAGQTATQNIPMRVSNSATSQGAKVQITFRYEYVDRGERGTANASENLSIPIYVPDRFILTQPDTELIGVQNEELAVSIPYVNKGKSNVSNVQAKLIFDESIAGCEQPNINLGNFEPGKSGTIDFYFVPFEPGSGSVQVVVTYEDELLKEKTITVDIPYSVDEAVADPYFDDMEMEEEPEEESPMKKILLIGIPVLAAVILIVVIVILKKRKKKKADPSVGFDWSFAQTEESTEDKTK